ncbi:hypothetical protein CDL12_09901 [Handroanthus impetiginosus]|uniref:NAC domain-containing protein n=1 Tax=Handroanthus impetiginosus TaxID=429701 RepID=A0A2G9HIT0_9LAMI|nr:hypothetical protein CDL12_09901 [Handroanthus impetiginosus]
MVVENNNCDAKNDKNEEVVVLPGFRFHPTDEELVGFYLMKKVQGKSIRTDLIKQIDIYKYDPWDLPKISSSNTGETEWYFFCMRGRKYRNSLRPNRVTLTGSGFWKATGIDKPIHDSSISAFNYRCIIGLKKSLVYYRGNAGKGTKTDWMMHEFRLPPTHVGSNSNISYQEAEIWTLCRIFKRDSSYKKYTPHWKQNMRKETSSESRTCSLESAESSGNQVTSNGNEVIKNSFQEIRSHFHNISEEIIYDRSPIISSSSSLWTENGDELFRNGNWDELGSVIRSL